MMDREKRRPRISRRQFLVGTGGLAVAAGAAALGFGRYGASEPIRIGILHSLSGTMAVSETPLRDAAMLAIEELNSKGGVLGRKIEAVIEDASSNNDRFCLKAEKLVQEDKVSSIFGCWTSASRKAVLPVLAKHNVLLWYPVQYEGNECSSNVIYTGSTPNQQIMPAVDWLHQNGKRRFYLVGSDYVFPRTANRIVKRQLQKLGAAMVGEDYLPLGSRDFEPVLKRIRAARPDIVFSTVNGDSNRFLYKAFYEAGITARDIPIMAVSLAEAEVRTIGTLLTHGHLAAWAYFQSVDTAENRSFIESLRNRYGAMRVTDDPIEAAYFQVHIWAQSVESAGTVETNALRQKVAGQKFNAPEGPIYIDSRNRHTWKMFRIGEIQDDGQFKVVYSSPGPLAPEPWDPEMNLGRSCDWETGS